MKTLIIAISIFLSGIGIGYAQEQIATNINLTDELKELCNLTPEQVAKVQPIVSDFEKKRDDTYKKYCHNRPLLNKAVTKNRWNFETKLIGILTPSQMGLLKAFDQRNPGIMTSASKRIHKVDYLADAK
jgi:hypothetical protein